MELSWRVDERCGVEVVVAHQILADLADISSFDGEVATELTLQRHAEVVRVARPQILIGVDDADGDGILGALQTGVSRDRRAAKPAR